MPDNMSIELCTTTHTYDLLFVISMICKTHTARCRICMKLRKPRGGGHFRPAIGGMGECRKLPHQGLGRSARSQSFFDA